MSKAPFPAKRFLRLQGSRHSALDMARGRIVIVSTLFALAYLLVGARMFDLSLIQGREISPEAGLVVAEKAPDVYRADITDRNGVILATSLDTASLYADPALIPDPVPVAKDLAALFPDISYGEVLRKLQKKGRFVWIRRNLTPQEQAGILELGEPGLGFRTERSRIYPQGDMAAHIVGYADVDGRGLAGIERSFDSLLAQGGTPLALTLDVRLQYVLRRELGRAVTEFSGKGGAGAIVDIASGEILAAASLPDFDPHDPGGRGPQALFNNLTLGVYEQGSTFKIFSTAALLETQDSPMARTFDAREPLQRGRFKISDYHPEKRILTIPEVFMYSSNIGAALMGEEVGTDRLKAFFADLGLMDPLKLEIDEIGKPLIPPVWRDINTLTASYGHGIAVSPLQTVIAASSIVGGGTLVRPTLILNRDKTKDPPEVRIVSPQTAHRMRQLMRLVVTDGTGKGADIPGYNVGGKTGTADKNEGGRYDGKKKISSFMGFFPMNAPRYAVFVMVDEPQGTKASYGYATGGWVAAPAVGRIVAAMGPLLGIAPDTETEDMAAPLKAYVHYADKEKPLASY